MNLNKQATLELTASLWLEINKSHTSKEYVLEEFGFYEDEFILDCPCCDYLKNNGIDPGYNEVKGYDSPNCAKHCLLKELWPNGCLNDPSPYGFYDNEVDSEMIAKYAGKLAKLSNIKLISCKKI